MPRVEARKVHQLKEKQGVPQTIFGYPLYDIKSISLQNGNEIFLNKKDLVAAKKAKQEQRPAIRSSIHLEDSQIINATKEIYVISRVKIVRTNGTAFYQEGFVLAHSSIAWICFYDPTNVLNLPIVDWSEAYDKLEPSS